MTREDARAMDAKLVAIWLNETYSDPHHAYYSYSDEELKELAHDALVLLKTAFYDKEAGINNDK